MSLLFSMQKTSWIKHILLSFYFKKTMLVSHVLGLLLLEERVFFLRVLFYEANCTCFTSLALPLLKVSLGKPLCCLCQTGFGNKVIEIIY